MDEHTPPGLRSVVTPPTNAVVVAGRYRVERLIARGGMAAVFLAEQIALRRRVALKILHPPPDADETGNYAQRFRLEAETLATLDHPNIVTLYDYGPAEDGRFFLAMEYIEGPRYTDLIASGRLDPDRTIQLILQVCAALRYAHRHGVVHRDLKPSNLLIRNDPEAGERVKVVDFGLVKVAEIDVSLTREGLVLGSPHCMAPEQVRGSGQIDHRADIYAIGVLLFRSLTGSYPFHAATSTATMVAHLNEPIPYFTAVAPDLRVPARLEDVVRRCLAKKPEDRYPDIQALMDDLAACAGLRAEPDTHTGSLQPDAPTTPPVVERPRRWPLVALVLVLLVSISAIVLIATRTPGPAPEAANPPVAPESPTVSAPTPPVAPPVVATPPTSSVPPVTSATEPTPPAKDAPVAAKRNPPNSRTDGAGKKPPATAPKSEDKAPEGYMGLPDDLK